MINNRQNGRRRGRGGQRPQGNPGRPDQGNRIDNRARGNAQQLHEKYKNLARDAQMAGDRVTTEYYLQFADHYFRVLNESRARFEDQRRQRDDGMPDEEFDDTDEFDQGASAPREMREPREQREQREPREAREPRHEQAERQPRRDAEAPAGEPRDDSGEERRARRPRRRREEGDTAEAPQSIEADRLPPAIAIESDAGGEAVAETPRRRRRTRVDTANDQVEVPPAA